MHHAHFNTLQAAIAYLDMDLAEFATFRGLNCVNLDDESDRVAVARQLVFYAESQFQWLESQEDTVKGKS